MLRGATPERARTDVSGARSESRVQSNFQLSTGNDSPRIPSILCILLILSFPFLHLVPSRTKSD